MIGELGAKLVGPMTLSGVTFWTPLNDSIEKGFKLYHKGQTEGPKALNMYESGLYRSMKFYSKSCKDLASRFGSNEPKLSDKANNFRVPTDEEINHLFLDNSNLPPSPPNDDPKLTGDDDDEKASISDIVALPAHVVKTLLEGWAAEKTVTTAVAKFFPNDPIHQQFCITPISQKPMCFFPRGQQKLLEASAKQCYNDHKLTLARDLEVENMKAQDEQAEFSVPKPGLDPGLIKNMDTCGNQATEHPRVEDITYSFSTQAIIVAAGSSDSV